MYMAVSNSGNSAALEVALSNEMQDFAISMMQRRKHHQTSLQLAKRLQAKYPSDRSEVGLPIAKTLQQMVVTEQLIGARRSLRQKPLRFEAIPLQFAAPAAGTEVTPSAAKFSFQSPSVKRTALPQLKPLTDIKSSKRSIEAKQLETRIEHSSHLILDPFLRELLSRILNIQIPNVKIYANELANTLVEKYDADALTYPNKILFRMNKYMLNKKEGIALLGHELTHAAQLNTQNSNTAANYRIQEKEALLNEQKILHYASFLETNKDASGINRDLINYGNLPNFNPVAIHTETSQAPPAQTQLPRMAASARDLSLPIETVSNSTTPSQLTEAQLSLIKEEIYRDLRQRIRVEFERGS